MNLNLSSAKLIGNPTSSGWAQVYDFAPEEEEKDAKRGHLVAVVKTGQFAEGVEAVSSGREILSRLNEEYFGNLTTSPFHALEEGTRKVIEEFKTWGEIEITAISLVKDVVYSVAAGGGEISIFRNGMLAKILVSKKEEVVSASGYPQKEDLMVLGTGRFFEVFPGGVIKGALENGDLEAAIESLAPTLHSLPDQGDIACALVSFKEEESLPVEVMPEKVVENVSPSINNFNPVNQKVKGIFNGIYASLQKKISGVLPERKIYVHGMGEEVQEEGSKKTTFTVGAILLVLLMVSIGFGIRQKGVNDQKSKYSSQLITVEQNLSEAENLMSLDPNKARDLFNQGREIVLQLQKQGIKDKKLTELSQKLQEKEGEILGEYQADPQLFLDLGILTSNFKGDEMVASEGEVYILDKGGKRIAGIEIANKKTEIVAGPDQISAPDQLAAYSGSTYILEGESLFQVGDQKREAAQIKSVGNLLIYVYAGNLYVLDKGDSSISRYPGASSGSTRTFGSKQNWLTAGVKADLTKIKSWVIDGNMWLLSESGKVSKFSLGNQVSFTPTGVFPEITQIQAIYTNEELKYLYLLDQVGGRIIVLEKNGNFKAQYISDQIKEGKSLIVSEVDKKMLVLTSDKLYTIEIKH